MVQHSSQANHGQVNESCVHQDQAAGAAAVIVASVITVRPPMIYSHLTKIKPPSKKIIVNQNIYNTPYPSIC